jgi:hypothetical protein
VSIDQGRPRGRRRGAICASLLLVVALGPLALTPLAGVAAPDPDRAHHAGFRLPVTGRADGGWIGAHIVGGGTAAYRIQPRQRDVRTAYRATKAVDDLGGRHAGPSARATQRAAYVLADFGGPGINVQSAGVDVATYHLLAGAEYRITGALARSRIGATGRRASTVYAYAKAVLEASARYAGPYRIRMTATESVGGTPSIVTLTVLSAAGHGMQKVPVRFRYDGSVVGQRRTDSDGQATIKVVPGGGGLSVIRADVTRLPHWKLFLRRAVNPRASDVAVAGRLASRTVRATIRAHGQQTVEITNAAGTMMVGGLMAGTYRINGGTGDRDVTSSAYGPMAGPAADCTGPASSVTEVVTGQGPFPLPDFTPERSGYYRWGVNAAANEFSVAGSACGQAVRVQKRALIAQYRPEGTDDSVALGEDFRTGVAISGFDRAEAGHLVTSVLYGPFTSKNAVTCDTRVAKTRTATVSGNGELLMGTVTVRNRANAGWYGWRSGLADGDLILGSGSECGVKVEVLG